MPLQGAAARCVAGVLWAGAAAGRRCQMCGWVCFGLVLWQGAAARCVAVKF